MSSRRIGHEEEVEIMEAVRDCEKCGKKWEEIITSNDPNVEIKFCESCLEKVKVIDEKWKNVKLDICGWPAKTRTEASVKKRKVIFEVYEEFLQAKRNCSEDSDCSECRFGQIEDRCILQELQIENDNGWIPCEEKLPPQPEENPFFEGKPLELYLVSEKGIPYPCRAFWNGKCFTDGFRKLDVEAWQPLPERYKKKEIQP